MYIQCINDNISKVRMLKQVGKMVSEIHIRIGILSVGYGADQWNTIKLLNYEKHFSFLILWKCMPRHGWMPHWYLNANEIMTVMLNVNTNDSASYYIYIFFNFLWDLIFHAIFWFQAHWGLSHSPKLFWNQQWISSELTGIVPQKQFQFRWKCYVCLQICLLHIVKSYNRIENCLVALFCHIGISFFFFSVYCM